jgi:hypothetical protein
MATLNGGNPVPGWQRISLDVALITLVASGLLWLLGHYAFGAGREDIGLPHWSESWSMRLHGLAGFAVLVAVGAFLPLHVPRGFAVLTAYALYYFAPDAIRPALGWFHALLGGAWGLTIIWHRRKRS